MSEGLEESRDFSWLSSVRPSREDRHSTGAANGRPERSANKGWRRAEAPSPVAHPFFHAEGVEKRPPGHFAGVSSQAKLGGAARGLDVVRSTTSAGGSATRT